MSKTNRKQAKKNHPGLDSKVVDEYRPGMNNHLVIGGLLVAMISIGLLIYILRDKVFHLNWLFLLDECSFLIGEHI